MDLSHQRELKLKFVRFSANLPVKQVNIREYEEN